MTTQEIASRLVELCRTGEFETAQRELFSDDVVSIEPNATPEFEKETKGLDAVIKKGHKFSEMTQDMHNMTVSDALVAGNSFAATIRMDVTMKNAGRIDVSELCVYKVKDGKVISEEFFM